MTEQHETHFWHTLPGCAFVIKKRGGGREKKQKTKKYTIVRCLKSGRAWGVKFKINRAELSELF